VPRVVVLGTSGAGKSTLARALADISGVPHVDLDDISAGDDFLPRVRELIEAPGWIIDGDYRRRLGDSVIAAADLAVWLDLPLRVSLARMWRRTLRRRLRREPQLLGWVAHEVRSHLERRFGMERGLRAHEGLVIVHLRSQADVDTWLAGASRLLR
jgi:adenylate kinase family enzyme